MGNPKDQFVIFKRKIKALFVKIKRIFIRKELNETVFFCSEKWEWSKKGADIIPGDVPVPTNDTFYYKLYHGDGEWYFITRWETKFFFIIPWSYDEHILEYPGEKCRVDPNTFTAEEALEELDNIDHWTRKDEIIPVPDITPNYVFIFPFEDGKRYVYNDDYDYFRRVKGET